MTLRQLEDELHTLNVCERFYKRLYEASTDEKIYHNFLKNIDRGFLKEYNLTVPGVYERDFPDYLEDWFFANDAKRNLYILKHDCYTPNFRHRHKFFEMMYVLEGHCSQDINGTTVGMTQGDVCILGPNVFHSMSVFDESIVLNVLIRRSTFEDIFFNCLRNYNSLSLFFLSTMYAPKGHDYIMFRTQGDEEIKNRVLEMFLEYRNDERYRLEMLDVLLLSFFVKLLRRHEDTCEVPNVKGKTDSRIVAILSYIEDNYLCVRLDEVAEKFNLTLEYASKLIKKETGQTFTQILRHIRMERAKALLRDTSVSVETICYEIGYMNPEHFIRTFKRLYDATPSEYRRNERRRDT